MRSTGGDGSPRVLRFLPTEGEVGEGGSSENCSSASSCSMAQAEVNGFLQVSSFPRIKELRLVLHNFAEEEIPKKASQATRRVESA